MAGTRFTRRDLVIRLRPADTAPTARFSIGTGRDGSRRVVPLAATEPGLLIELPHDQTVVRRTVPPDALARLNEQTPVADLAQALWSDPAIRDALAHWLQSRDPTVWGANPPSAADPVVDRLCLRIDADRMVGLPLEQSLHHLLAEIQPRSAWLPPIPRLIAVPPRVAQVPLSLPLRLLQLDSRGDFDLPGRIRAVLGSHARGPGSASIVQVATGHSRRFANWTPPSGWRTVDVLHLDRLPAGSEKELLAMSAPGKPSTLGWLVRCADLWRTRLVVLRAGGGQMPMLRRFAHRLVAQGGPAVFLVDDATPDPATELNAFYDKLIHDAPIDVAAAIAASQPGLDLLFAGAGREELLRVSTPGEALAALGEGLSDPNAQTRANAAGNLWSTLALGPADLRLATTIFARAVRGVMQITTALPALNFNIHEGDGLVPLGQAIGRLRQSTRTARAPAAPLRPTPDRTGPRFANINLTRIEPDGGNRQEIPQHEARLREDEPIVLGVQLGPPDGFAPVLDAVALIEEPFKWEKGNAGVWLSVGVTGLNFTVRGTAIQEVWLPRDGASDLIEFIVEPTRIGISQLRLCLYHGTDLLQSHRLAAIVDGLQPHDVLATSETLAQALGITSERAGTAGWLARMEYAAAADLSAPPAGRNVALSLFANDIDGRQVVTLRGKESYEVLVTGDTGDLTTDIRTQLDAVSRDEFGLYAFRARDATPTHSATPEQRDAALHKLAQVGWNLYSAIFAGADRAAMVKDLADPGQIIHVAHSLLENVIPWAAMYDRSYDSDRQKDDAGLPLLRAVCPAGLPDATGEFPATECGVRSECPLSAQGRQAATAAGQGIAEEAIVCARHFWGFRHIVELPPLQGSTQAETGAPAPATIAAAAASRWDHTSAGKPLSLLFGYNSELGTAVQHGNDLDALLPGRKLSGVWTRENDRDDLLKALRRGDADLVYLFCHARGGKDFPDVRPPALVFRESVTPPNQIRPGALAQGLRLSHHPLVILNGCNTVAFSPDALSPFISTLVRDCEAAGAIGTEIPVFELLAGEVARQFLTRFLDGENAGQALLNVRRDLLTRGNPMGLAYTLYAVAELRLVQQGTGP